jgi:osmotically-inducible protein OsmY
MIAVFAEQGILSVSGEVGVFGEVRWAVKAAMRVAGLLEGAERIGMGHER